MATGRIYWSEASGGVRGRIFWSAVAADAPAGLMGRIFWSAVDPDAAPDVYTLTAEAGSYTMTWAGSVGQVVLDAGPGAYLMAEQPATLTVIFDVTSPTINTGDNLRFLKDRNRRPVLFPD